MHRNDFLNNENFIRDYEKLKDVPLNPDRHTAENAHLHCEMVRERVDKLAKVNSCTPEETELLACLALVHDIGKINGTSYPSASVELLPTYGVNDAHLIRLVDYHDCSLSWYNSAENGQPPKSKAWKKLARRLDIWILTLFMVADRIDAPGGWGVNDALVWFMDEARERGYLRRRLTFDENFIVEVENG
jgi:hypothetical protein